MFKKKIKMALFILIILLLLTGCKNTDYKKAQSLISEGNYDSAIMILETIPDYKDSKDILEKETAYRIAKVNIEDKYYISALEGFKSLNDYRDAENIVKDLNSKISEHYNNGIKCLKENDIEGGKEWLKPIMLYKDVPVMLDYIYAKETYDLIFEKTKLIDIAYEINNFKNHIDELPYGHGGELGDIIDEYKKEMGSIQNINKIAEYYSNQINRAVSEKDYSELSTALYQTKDIFGESTYYYGEALVSHATNKSMDKYYLCQIDPDYNGFLAEDIKKFAIQVFGSKENWIKERNKEIEIVENVEEVKLEPQIGMTKEEVENSTWGIPEKINKTTTAFGVSEQWVYPNYQYIYFDNGIVTAIQESN